MNSIKKKLTLYISSLVSLLLIVILLITDVSVDSWISNEFDRAMHSKANMLVTLVSENNNGVEFDFSDEFMPEFSGKADSEYFQFWRGEQTFEKSNTLKLFDVKTLPKTSLGLNEYKVSAITLPDGRSGRMYFIKFKPQIDSDIRKSASFNREQFSQTQQAMELAYAISNESLNQILWFVDIIFVVTSLLAIFLVRFIVFSIVSNSMRPLDQLNKDLKEINLESELSVIKSDKLPLELIPISDGINYFLKENKQLYAREKRITSDIAHELKTPITELINLAEIAIKFPHETQISDNFKEDVLGISQRLKGIVTGILSLQKSHNHIELVKSKFDLALLIERIVTRENYTNRTINLHFANNPANSEEHSSENFFTTSNEIAVETIVSNLINNALFYSPQNSVIDIDLQPGTDKKQLLLSISNVSTHQYNNNELDYFFEPLWQKDASRTSSERYGLGLAIVKSYCERLQADIVINFELNDADMGVITFTITFN